MVGYDENYFISNNDEAQFINNDAEQYLALD